MKEFKDQINELKETIEKYNIYLEEQRVNLPSFEDAKNGNDENARKLWINYIIDCIDFYDTTINLVELFMSLGLNEYKSQLVSLIGDRDQLYKTYGFLSLSKRQRVELTEKI